jgi:hypothetical protein
VKIEIGSNVALCSTQKKLAHCMRALEIEWEEFVPLKYEFETVLLMGNSDDESMTLVLDARNWDVDVAGLRRDDILHLNLDVDNKIRYELPYFQAYKVAKAWVELVVLCNRFPLVPYDETYNDVVDDDSDDFVFLGVLENHMAQDMNQLEEEEEEEEDDDDDRELHPKKK